MPQDSPAATGDPAWHQALAYAVTGRRLADLGRQDRPDLPWLTDYLSRLTQRDGRKRPAGDPPPSGESRPTC